MNYIQLYNRYIQYFYSLTIDSLHKAQLLKSIKQYMDTYVFYMYMNFLKS